MTDIDHTARQLERRINALIESSCEGESHLRWRTIAEQEVEATLDQELWGFLWFDRFHKPPHIKITEYRG